jgi:hypothetical protein
MRLFELANTSYPFKLVANRDDVNYGQRNVYSFNVPIPGNVLPKRSFKYNVYCYLHKGEFEVIFEMLKNPVSDNVIDLTNVEVETLTGTGNSFRVLSTVLEILKKEIRENPDIHTIAFSSKEDEESRTKLYSRFANNVSKFLPGWKLNKVGTEYGSYHKYYLTKI